MRGLIGFVLFLGLVFGWFGRVQRQVAEQEALVAELARDGIVVNGREPTQLCLALSLPLAPPSSRNWLSWLSLDWISRPIGFNAGTHLRDEDVPRAVKRLQRLGDVHEAQFHGGSLNGLRLFHIGKMRYRDLGPEQDTCTSNAYPVRAATPGSLRHTQP
jgi:hypothetical protein